jgi:hypothetical protein
MPLPMFANQACVNAKKYRIITAKKDNFEV